MNQLIYLILLAVVEIFGDFSLEKYANTGKLPFLGYGSIFYVGVVYFLIKSLQGSTILIVNVLWDGISSIIETLAAMIILKERLSHPYQYVGLIMTIVGMVLLKWGNKETFGTQSISSKIGK